MKKLSQNEWIAVSVSFLVLILFFYFPQFLSQLKETGDAADAGAIVESELISESSEDMTTETLKIEEVVVGTGAEAVAGSVVTIHYTGLLLDGTKFDSSVGREPFPFVIGEGQVIPGFEQGVTGMKTGGKRKITIPPHLGYGNRQAGPIPPNSTLVFEIELLDVK